MPFAKMEKTGRRAVPGRVGQNLEFCFGLAELLT